MNEEKDIFYNMDAITIEKISNEFPILTDEEKERMFAMSERKYRMSLVNSGIGNNDVEGVEEYSRPRWIKFAGIAAAAAIIVGGIGGGGFLMHSMKKTAPEKQASEVATEVSETTTSNILTTTTNTVTIKTTSASDDKTNVTSIVTVYSDDNNAINETTPSAEQTTDTTPVTNNTSQNEVPDDIRQAADKVLENYLIIDDGYFGWNGPKVSGAAPITLKIQLKNWDEAYDLLFTPIDSSVFPDMQSLKAAYHSMIVSSSEEDADIFGPELSSSEYPEGSLIDLKDRNSVRYLTYDGVLYGAEGQRGSNIALTNWDENAPTILNVTETSFDIEKISGAENMKSLLKIHAVKDSSTGNWLIASFSWEEI